VVQTLATLGCRGESLAEVAHDARNMVTALGLYCDLLEEPGVLAMPFVHYGSELRLVAAASRRLVEKLVSLDGQPAPEATGAGMGAESGSGAERAPGPALASLDRQLARGLDGSLHQNFNGSSDGNLEPGFNGGLKDGHDGSLRNPDLNPDQNQNPEPVFDRSFDRSLSRALDRSRHWEMLFAEPVDNLAAELLANRNLLSALAGPGIAVTVDAAGGARAVRLTSEDLTRLLVNLVKNAAEAMPAGAAGHVQVSLRERALEGGDAGWLVLAVEDNGPGIAALALDRVFESGFTTQGMNPPANGGWPAAHRGLGLAITRSIVEASGGRISASNRSGPNVGSGARIEIELPVRAR
jgi:signal transduction histidine kinase